VTLVERFVEQHTWPTSRKTAWLMGLSLPAAVAGTAGYTLAIRNTGFVDVSWVVAINLYGIGGTAAAWVCGLLAWRAGREGRWTAYLAGCLFCSWMFLIIHGLGTWSTAFVLWIPMIVLLTALWYDVWLATLVLAFQVALLTLGEVGRQIGLYDYAPLLSGRSIDDHRSAWWIAANVSAVASGVLATCAMAFVAAQARELQDRRLNLAFTTIRRYVPGQVADALLLDPDRTPEQHERRRLTIFFSDLVGFTDISDEYEPEDLSRLLNEYFTEMTTIAHQYGGTIDELSGDAILVLFGAPQATDDRDHALRAVRMARDMQDKLTDLNRRWRDEGRADRLDARMGVDTGVVTVGNFGSPERMKYAALGRHVNAAARLQAECPPGRILLSHSTWLLIRDEIPCSPNGELTLKGLHKPVETYIVDTLR
jgi:class 3 adenylate cyclase